MKTTRITDKIDYIQPEQTPFASTSSALFIKSTPSIDIDLNLGFEDTNKFINQCNPDIALLSHYHLDHSLNAPIMDNHDKIELWIPEDEADYLTSLDHFIDNTCGPYEISEKFRNMIQHFLTYPEIKNFKTFSDNEIFKCKDLTLKTISVPGHSPSHTAFYIPEEKILFTSDIGIGNWGPWYGWIDSNIPQYIDSLLRLKTYKDVNLVTCHDGIFSKNIENHWDACIDSFFEREELVLDMMDQGRTKDEIIEKGIYFKKKFKVAEPMKSLLTVQDEIMLEHHMNAINDGGLKKLFPKYNQ
jgi:hydroxyacylglutathione hydrolase